jgi:hypothetical protein
LGVTSLAVDHDRWQRQACGIEAREAELDVERDVVAGERPDLDRVRVHVRQQHAQLIQHHARKDGKHLMDLLRILDGEGRDDSGSVDAQAAEDLEIGLEARSTGGIRGGDAQGDPHGRKGRERRRGLHGAERACAPRRRRTVLARRCPIALPRGAW